MVTLRKGSAGKPNGLDDVFYVQAQRDIKAERNIEEIKVVMLVLGMDINSNSQGEKFLPRRLSPLFGCRPLNTMIPLLQAADVQVA